MDKSDSSITARRWGAIAAFLLAAAFIIAPFIYLTGNLRDRFGAVTYSLADFLAGPVWAASLVTLFFVLRERIGPLAQRRMTLAMIAAVLAAGATASVAFIRSANRYYHLIHPELHLESSQTLLIGWTTLVAGVGAAGWHFLGWAFVLTGSAGLASSGLPRPLSILYLAAGVASWFVYLLPESEGLANMLCVVASLWQGILLWRGREETKADTSPALP